MKQAKPLERDNLVFTEFKVVEHNHGLPYATDTAPKFAIKREFKTGRKIPITQREADMLNETTWQTMLRYAVVEEEKPLEDMSKQELLDYASDNGFTINANLSKTKILEALKDA